MSLFDEMLDMQRKLEAAADPNETIDPPATIQDVREAYQGLMREIHAVTDMLDAIVDLLVLRGVCTDAEVRLAYQIVSSFQSNDGSFEEFLESRREYLESYISGDKNGEG